MKVWITKYALTQGIFTRDVEKAREYPGLVTVKGSALWDSYHGEGKEWHRTRESAVKRAEQMRDKKIASLEKQLARIKGLSFDG